MSDWTAGYVADVDYTYGYYGELNPQRVAFAFLNAGIVPPKMGAACELGFGQGLSTNIHAAASVTHWSGTDFNPAQASFAQELAAASGASAALFDEAFEKFCLRDDLPDFDYIGLHGIWSWISDANRRIIVDFIGRKLKVGGVLYISYNTLPGWASMMPMRHLLTEHAEVMGAPGMGIVSRIDAALEFTDKLVATNPAFTRANPGVIEKIAHVKKQSRNYLAHEYFNRDWLPMHFADMASTLAGAKLSFACSAYYVDMVDALNLTDDQVALLRSIPDPMFRESIRDFMTNQQFRRDYWVKGRRKLAQAEQSALLMDLRFVLVSARAEVNLGVTGAIGKAEMQPNVYLPVLDYLADNKVRSLAEIVKAVEAANVSAKQALQALVVLVGKGDVVPAQEEAVIERAKPTCDKLNIYLINKARTSSDMSFLASPVTGGGIPVGRFQQMFLLAISQGMQKPAEWAALAWNSLQAQNQLVLKEGKALQGLSENMAELERLAEVFARNLPRLKALGIVH